jgi:short-subunit dehydrogenase
MERSTIEDAGLAVITGASSGIGATFAEHLAARGLNVVLVARRQDRLEAVARSITTRYPVSVEIKLADLSRPESAREFAQYLSNLENVEFLVNSAGFGTNSALIDYDPLRLEQEIYLDLVALILFNRAVLPRMLAKAKGNIINVSSVGGLNPSPYFAPYAATKAAVIRFTQSLYGELKGSGVKVQVLCPGPVPTEFNAIANVGEMPVPKFLVQSSDDLVKGSLRDLDRGVLVSIPHSVCRRLFKFIALLPLEWRLSLIGNGMKKSAEKSSNTTRLRSTTLAK